MAEENGAINGMTHWISAIPEVHYDFLARVFPGLILLSLSGAAFIAFQDRAAYLRSRSSLFALTHSSMTLASAIIYLVLALVFSWCLGMLLTPFGDSLHKLLFRYRVFRDMAHENHDLLEKAVNQGVLIFAGSPSWKDVTLSIADKGLAERTYQQLHDQLKETSPSAQRVLAKNQAELTFYTNVSAALILHLVLLAPSILFLARINPALLISTFRSATFLLILLPILLLVLSLWGQRAKQSRIWQRHLAFLIPELNRRAALALAAQNVASSVALNSQAKPQSFLDILRKLLA